jgi:hypothetical protein
MSKHPPSSTTWLSQTVFVSSTFKDFQAERDYLREVIVPRVREELETRGIPLYLDLVDLRWGVNTLSVGQPADLSPEQIEQEKNLIVLRYCLDEIDNSRPFFLALLGDRYGCVPPLPLVCQTIGRRDWQQPPTKEELARMSLTELEIRYAIQTRGGVASRARVYVRDSLECAGLVESGRMSSCSADIFSNNWRPSASNIESSETREGKRLRDWLLQTIPERVHRYSGSWDTNRQQVTGLSTWGNEVYSHLLMDIESQLRELFSRSAATPLEAFISRLTRGFVGREDDLTRLLNLVLRTSSDNDVQGACIISEPGVGKSSLFAKLSQALGDYDALLLVHAVGSESGSQSVSVMLKGWVQRLASYLDAPIPETADDEKLDAAFAGLLARAASRHRVILLVDAVELFESTVRSRNLTWLPSGLPQNVRFVFTMCPCPTVAVLARRQSVQQWALRPLHCNEEENQASEAGRIVDLICKERGRILPSSVRACLLSKMSETPLLNGPVQAAGNALWLTLAAEELNRLDADDFNRLESFGENQTEEKRLLALLMDEVEHIPGTVDALYTYLLIRAEKLVGEHLVRAFIEIMVTSRGGWRETDLRGVSGPGLLERISGQPWNSVSFAQLRHACRTHILNYEKRVRTDI